MYSDIIGREYIMKQKKKNGIPALLSMLVFLTVEGINIFGNVPFEQWKNFENISNTVMLMVAMICFFWLGFPSKRDHSRNLGSVLGNVAISVIAFFMNINVFEHTIQLEMIWTDLKGWHVGWTFCAIVQILFLTRLAEQLLTVVQGFLMWGGKTIKPLGNGLSGFTAEIGNCDKGLILIFMGGFGFWVVYLIYQIFNKGTFAVIFSADILWGSVRLWTVCIIIGFLLYLFPLICKKGKEAIKNIDEKKILLAMLAAAILGSLSYALLILLGIIGIIMIMLIVLVGLLWYIVKRSITKSNSRVHQNNMTAKNTINLLDLSITLIAFIVVPLMLICIVTFFSPEGNHIINSQDVADYTTWLNLLGVALEVTNSMLQLFTL